MILSDICIKTRLKEGSLIVSPLDENQIQPASIDINLGKYFMRVDENSQHKISFDKKIDYIEFSSETVVMPPQSFLLAITEQYVELPNDLIIFVEGRSSISRMGLFIQNAGWINPGYKGNITLELYNVNKLPFELKVGTRICQFVVAKLELPAEKLYTGKYQGNKGIVGSKIYLEVQSDEKKI